VVRCRVVTWNIHACVGSDGRYDVARVAEVLAGLDADIIGLQEVDWRRPAEGGGDAFDMIAARLGMHGVEGPNLHDHRGRYGNGLLTRYPVSDVTHHSLLFKTREPRGVIDATLQHDSGTAIRTFVTHLGLKFRERRHQVAMIRAAATGSWDSPALLLGDMNEWVSTRLMRNAFTPSPFSHMVTGRSFPSRWPMFPLDYIFTWPEPLHCEGRVVRSAKARRASDHLPVLADIEWPEMG
jgi:endonuclease/exonuclease/phosphatase family metal-dependent hydrolase